MARFKLVLLLVCVATLASAQPALKPGRYSITIETEVPGAPAPVTGESKHCVGPDDVGDFQSLLKQQSGADDDDCVYSNVVTAGDTVSWDTTCEDVTARSKISFTADGYDAVVLTVAEGRTFTTRAKARWIGAVCLPEDEQ